jgi:hypothetical protein
VSHCVVQTTHGLTWNNLQDSDNDSDDSDDESESEFAPSATIPQSAVDITVPVINVEQSNEYGA